MNGIRKRLFGLALCFSVVQMLQAQPCSPPQTRAWIHVTDSGSGSDILWFGFDSTASCGVDPHLCESDFAFPCSDPPVVIFCAFWHPWCNPELGGLIRHDYRHFYSSAQVDTYQVRFDAGQAGYPMHFRWNRTSVENICDSATLKDEFNGVLYKVRMDLQDSLEVNLSWMHQLLIIKYGAKMLATHAGEWPQSIPSEFNLQQNYPNPFNPTTTIRYALPHTSFVTLTVYNTIGQQVAQLVNEQQQAGYHDVVFRGEGLSSGVYFYRIQAGDFVASKKLLLLK